MSSGSAHPSLPPWQGIGDHLEQLPEHDLRWCSHVCFNMFYFNPSFRDFAAWIGAPDVLTRLC